MEAESGALVGQRICLGLPGQPCLEFTARSRCVKCEREFDRRRGTARERGYDAEYEANKDFVLSKSKICWRCGDGGADTADHVIPRSRGGSNAVSNLRPAHASCNYSAGGALSRGGRGQE